MLLDLSGLNERQCEAVTHRGGPLLVLAGAGSGKTRVITYRTAHLVRSGVESRRILVVTFTNKAAEEMRGRILEKVPARLGKELTLSTFHAFGARLLRKHIYRLGFRPNFTILDEADRERLVKTTLSEAGLKRTSVSPSQVARIISRAKRSQTNPAGLKEMRFSPFLPHAQRVFDSYNEHLRSLNSVDFDDLLALPLKLCAEIDDVRQAVAEMFEHVMVDEYQDTNFIQVALLKRLSGHGNVAVVGDDDQSIYGFQGALADNIGNFDRTFPGAKVIKLEQNYRSVQSILKAANALIINNRSRHDKTLWSERGEGGKIRFVSCANERDEAEFVARDLESISEQHRLPYAHMAVLYRTNSQARLFEESLRKRQIPYRVVGSTELFDRVEVRDWFAYLTVLVNRRDEIKLRRIVNVPRRGIGPASMKRIDEHARAHKITLFDALKQANSMGNISHEARKGADELVSLIDTWSERMKISRGGKLQAACREFLEATGLIEYVRRFEGSSGVAHQKVDTLMQLIDGIVQIKQGVSLPEYLSLMVLDARKNEARDAEGSRVTLMTLHSAKGLQFPHVYLVGFERELLPHRKSLNSAASISEERRLCYVGMTRAMDRLTLTAARTRTWRRERIPKQVSMFLKEIPADLLDTEAGQESLSAVQEDRNRSYLDKIQEILKG